MRGVVSDRKSPLAYGFLAGGYTREDLAKPDNRFSGFDLLQFDKEQAFALVDAFQRQVRSQRCRLYAGSGLQPFDDLQIELARAIGRRIR